MITQFSFDKSEISQDSDSDESYTVDSPFINLNESHFIKRPLMQRGPSEDDTFSVNLRFKKAIEGRVSYFEHWLDRISDDEIGRKKFFENDVKCRKMSLLHYAAQHYQFEICKILIEKFKFDPNVKAYKNLTPLHALVKFNSRLKLNLNNNELITSTPSSSPLLSGLKRNNDAINLTIQVLIDNGAQVDAQNINGETPFHYACIKDNIIAAQKMISRASYQLKDEQKMTPLHVACKYGSENVFNLLLTRTEPEVLATDVDNKSALSLHHACSCKVEKVEMVEMILSKLKFHDDCKKTDYLKKALEQRNSRNKLPLHICIENNHVKLVELLIKYNADVNYLGGNIEEHPVHMAAKIGSIEIMEILESIIQNRADLTVVNKKNENLLHVAAISNQYEFILKYYKNEFGKNGPACTAIHATNLREQTPLLLAVTNDNIESVDALLKCKANIDDKDIEENSIFHLCAFHNNIRIFKYLLDLPKFSTNKENLLSILKQTDKYDNTFVHIACKNNNLDILKFLFSSKLLDDLSKAELVFAKNNYEQTGFHISCFEGHYEIVKFFLTIETFNQSALVQDVDETFNTCLHLAAMKGHHRIASLLIKHNAMTDARNNEDLSPLDVSCKNGFVKVAKILLKTDGFINLNDCKIHPLLLASSNGQAEIVKLLLDYKAKLTCLNESNENCLDLALDNNHKQVVQTILNQENWMDVINRKDRGKQFEKLIKKMPEMMEFLLNKIEEKKVRTKDYDFTVLDNHFDKIQQHSLMIMAKSKKEYLLKHSVTQKLIELKWKRAPQYVYLINLILYIIFVILLSIHVSLSNKSLHVYSSNSTENSTGSENLPIRAFNQDLIVYSLTVGLLLIQIVKELLQLSTEGLLYFYRLDNIVECLTYSTTLIFMIPLSLDKYGHMNDYFVISDGNISFHRCEWQWQLGSICILLAWLVLVFFIEKFLLLGKYVVMFHRILLNSLQFFPVFSLFIIGFAFSFSMLLSHKQSDFSRMPTVIMKTLSMMIGELDFEKVFIENSWANYIVFSLFVSLICIIILNLLVGLAVGDINKVENDAYVTLMKMKIEFLLQIQNSFRDKFCFNNNFMRYEIENVDNVDKDLNTIEWIIQKILNLLYTIFNKSQNNSINHSNEDVFVNSIKDLKSNFVSNFESINLTMVKLKNEIKLLKVQNQNSQLLINDFKRKFIRNRSNSQ